MPTWDEWEELVINSQKGDRSALNSLLEESEGIIRQGIFGMLGPISNIDVDEISQLTRLKILQTLPKFRKPRGYLKFLQRVIANRCHDYQRKQDARILLDEIDESGSLADKKGLWATAESAFQDHIIQIIEQDYPSAKSSRAHEKRKFTEPSKKRNRSAQISQRKLQEIPTAHYVLERAMADKEVYDYPEAEERLRTLVKFTDKGTLNNELIYIRARAVFELGHLKMNEGIIAGPEGSIDWYTKALKLWHHLKDFPNEVMTLEQIGVSHHISGNDPVALKVYEDLFRLIRHKQAVKGIKSSLWCNHSNALLALRDYPESDRSIEKSIGLAEDFGGLMLSFSQLQKAKLCLQRAGSKRSYYDKAYPWIEKSVKGIPAHDVLNLVKANIVLFDLYVRTDERIPALDLRYRIEENCKKYLFHHQLAKLNDRLIRYRLT